MIPANGAPHDLEARDVLRSLSFAQRRARDNSNQIGASPNCRPSTTFTRSISMSAASRSPFASNTTHLGCRRVLGPGVQSSLWAWCRRQHFLANPSAFGQNPDSVSARHNILIELDIISSERHNSHTPTAFLLH
jgi:hypothetical protein